MTVEPTRLTLPEEVLLLALDDGKGTISMTVSGAIEYALAGAQLLELALADRVRLDGKALIPVTPTVVNDPELDGVLARIAGESKPRTVKWWVSKLHSKARRTYTERLVERGLVAVDKHRILGVFPTTRHPEAQPEVEDEIRARVRAVLVDGAEPDARTAGLIGLVSASSLTGVVLPDKAERKRAKGRIKAVTETQPVSAAVTAIVNEINAAVMVAVIASTAATSAS